MGFGLSCGRCRAIMRSIQDWMKFTRMIMRHQQGHSHTGQIGNAQTAAQRQERVVDDDRYLSVRSLAVYSGLSVRTIRSYLIHAADPLPHYRVGGKILVRRSEFDAWACHFRVTRPSLDFDTLVGDLVGGLR